MRVILIHPPFPPFPGQAVIEPLGVAYLASFLREYAKNKINIELLDANALNLTVSQALDWILLQEPDVLGLSFQTPQADFTYELSKTVREHRKNLSIVHGGIHTTVNYVESLNNYADYCVIGEGEVTFLELVECIRENDDVEKVRGIAYKKNDSLMLTEPRPFIDDLDIIPYPAWDLLPFSKYTGHIHVRAGRALPIMASRGCPFNCTFCASPFIYKRRVRYRSVENVIGELEHNIKKYKINKFHFYDDNLFLNPIFIRRLCNAIIEKQLNIQWISPAKVNSINRHPQILEIAKKAGCVGLEIGVESGDQNVLDSINKQQTLSDIKNAFNEMNKASLETAALQLMTFNIGETINGHYYQNRFLTELTESSGVFWGSLATPYPGSKFGQTAKEEGIILAKRWSDYSCADISFVPNSILYDIPKRNLKELRMIDLIYVLRNYSKLPLPSYKVRNMLQLFSLIKRILLVYDNCDGETTTKEIAEKMAKEYNMTFEESLKCVVRQIVVFAQMGLIRSAKTEDVNVRADWQLRWFSSPDSTSLFFALLKKAPLFARRMIHQVTTTT